MLVLFNLNFTNIVSGLVNLKTNNSSLIYETINLGTKDNPQNIDLGKGCSEQERSAFINLFK